MTEPQQKKIQAGEETQSAFSPQKRNTTFCDQQCDHPRSSAFNMHTHSIFILICVTFAAACTDIHLARFFSSIFLPMHSYVEMLDRDQQRLSQLMCN